MNFILLRTSASLS